MTAPRAEPAGPRPGLRYRQVDRPAVGIVIAVLAGLLAGTALTRATRPDPPPAPPALVAVASLQSVVLRPAPSAVLAVRATNVGPDPITLDTLTVGSGGVARTTVAVHRVVPGGGTDGSTLVTTVVAPLDCTAPAGGDQPTVTARIVVDDTPHEVIAEDVGRVGRLGGICAAADAALPGGWRNPVAATARRDGDTLDLTLTGLPADAAGLLWIDADGVLLPATRPAPAVRSGRVRLVLGPPTPGCRDGGMRAVVPTGLQVHLQGPTGLIITYAPVGTTMAEWFMDAYVRACPSRPNGPALANIT